MSIELYRTAYASSKAKIFAGPAGVVPPPVRRETPRSAIDNGLAAATPSAAAIMTDRSRRSTAPGSLAATGMGFSRLE